MSLAYRLWVVLAVENVGDVCENLQTVRDFVRWGASRFAEAGLFFGHGTDNALDEAYTLVLHALHLPNDIPPTYLEALLTAPERRSVYELLSHRLQRRIPASYLTREAWFAGFSFYVDERVLIPRSPIAELIERQFAPFIDPQRVERILDLGTGSGCIAVACAHAFPDARVDAVDVAPEALEVAAINVERYHLEDRVHALRSDAFGAVPDQRYDLIVSNPPYVGKEEMSELPQEYRREPDLALAAGTDGLDIVRRILAGAPDHLAEGGIMVVEVGNSEQALTQAYPDVPFLWLEFERGGSGVFLLSYEQVQEFAATFAAAA